MFYLFLVSAIWAFSFGLIKGQLTGLDPFLVAAIRLFLALLVFLPFTSLRRCPPFTGLALVVIGAIQYGLMYAFYTASFAHLQSYEVALFTIFTPLYVALVHDLFRGRFHRRFFLMATLAVAGSTIVLYRGLPAHSFNQGFLWLQGANLCFAFGQVAYCEQMKRQKLADRQIFSLLYLGGVLATAPVAAYHGSWIQLGQLTAQQLLTLIYLGTLASGLCFFGWNYGARRVNAGILAVSNNLKIPLAVFCSGWLFGERIALEQLLIGSVLLLGALMLQPQQR
ncbi:MAG: EamA family transporter [Desulfuromonadaceae bacterium]|nr:EamA family transporter [Desulfuromonadaceae bacterium]